jgi:hypothetical protein
VVGERRPRGAHGARARRHPRHLQLRQDPRRRAGGRGLAERASGQPHAAGGRALRAISPSRGSGRRSSG